MAKTHLTNAWRPMVVSRGMLRTCTILSNIEHVHVINESMEQSTSYGLNLYYRSLASILKYDSEIPIIRTPKNGRIPLSKGYYNSEANLVERIKDKVGYSAIISRSSPQNVPPFKTVECSIMDVADDIAYTTYDLDDAFHGGFFTPITLFTAALPRVVTIADMVRSKLDRAFPESAPHLDFKPADVILTLVDLDMPALKEARRFAKIMFDASDTGEIDRRDAEVLVGSTAFRASELLASQTEYRTSFMDNLDVAGL